MKKQVIIILFLFVSVLTYAQGSYKISVNGTAHQSKNANCGEYIIEATLTNNTKVTIAEGSFGTHRFSINKTKIISSKFPVRRIRFYAKRWYKAWLNSCGQHETGETTFNIYKPYNCFYSTSVQHGNGLFGNGLWHSDLTVKVEPIIEVLSLGINDFLPLDHKINLKATSGFPEDLSSYHWQYRLNYSGSYKSLPSVINRKSSIWVSARDILKNSAEAYLGKKIQFRIKSCNLSVLSTLSKTPRTYTIVPSAPTFISNTVNNPSCYNSGDGNVRFKFSRPLFSGEKLAILPEVGSSTFPSVPEIINLQANPDTGVLDSYTIENLHPGSYRATVIGFYGKFNTYSEASNHSMSFTIGRPSPVEFNITEVINSRCNDGDGNPNNNNDGEIQITAKGGNSGVYQYSYRGQGQTFSNWKDFSTPTQHRLTLLKPDNYEIRVRKLVRNRTKECIAYILNSSNIPTATIKVVPVRINEPPVPLQIQYVAANTTEPTANGFTNGQIKAHIIGGTPLNNDKYNYVWRNNKGIILTSTLENVETDGSGNKQFFVTLTNIGSGIYFLTATDKNYNTATYRTGCSVTNSSYSLGQPDPLILNIQETKPISCNPENTQIDKDKDGELTAHASGGVHLKTTQNRGLPYYYTWKKKNPIGVWEIYQNKNIAESTIHSLSAGEYAVNIEDANGIIIGTYTNTILVKANDVIYTLKAPNPILINVNKQNVYCHGGNDGYMHTTITGGTGTYTIKWLDDAKNKTTNRDNLYTGKYTILVKDSNGCSAKKTIEIAQPDKPVTLTYPEDFKQPTAFGLTNGWIEARVSGGTPAINGSYNFIWTDQDGKNWNANVVSKTDPTTGDYSIRLQNIGKGTYTLTITDANYKPATIKDSCTTSKTFLLDEPLPLVVTITEDKPISCNQDNEYGDPFSDGVLTAHATGGVRFKTGLPYQYTWKKKKNTTDWQVLTKQTDSTATNLDDGLYAVNIKDANGIVLGEYLNNLLSKAIDSTRILKEPALLQVALSKRDVFCHLGSDGWVTAAINGGTPPYTILWNTGDTSEKITKLPEGNYEVIVTDSRGCQDIKDINITQPSDPITITYTAYGRPSKIEASDAWIEANIKGGTPMPDKSYTYRWANKDGIPLNPQTSTKILADNTYSIRLNTITAGTYFLTIEDQNYPKADTKEGCTTINSEFTIYEPIEAIIEEYIPISCNQKNKHLDPFSDGAIVGHVSGGVPFTSGLPYKYTWKKQNPSGTWETLTTQTDSIATDLSAGKFALNAEDSMGQIMGIYQSDLLIQATDSIYQFIEPELVQLKLSTTPISCDKGNNGTATVEITGGTPPYIINWSTGGTTSTIHNLISGNYTVYVTDSRGCQATDKTYVAQPGGILVTSILQKDPTCYQGNDGQIVLNVTGGTPPYQFLWNTGQTTLSLDHLNQGTYTLEIKDSQGCIAYQQIKLSDPLPVPINLGENRMLCKDQILTLDITIPDDPKAIYLWQSDTGFSSNSPVVDITKEGRYNATITTSLGCIGYDEVEVKKSEKEVDADFLLTTQAYTNQEIILVNVSHPIGDKIEWTVPKEIKIIEQTNKKLTLRFPTVGTYNINLRSYQGDCYQDYNKSIMVAEGKETAVTDDNQKKFIEEFIVYPNPNTGKFNVKLSLGEIANVSLKIINLITSTVLDTREEKDLKEYLLEYQVNNLPSGLYLLTIETPMGNAIRKLIIE